MKIAKIIVFLAKNTSQNKTDMIKNLPAFLLDTAVKLNFHTTLCKMTNIDLQKRESAFL